MPRYACRCVIDGRAFAGTAPQPGRPTVHGRLRAILAELDGGREVVTRSCGRLDAGTSALAWVMDAELRRERDPVTLARAISGHLQPALVVAAAAEVPGDWHARRCCRSKTYRYRIYEATQPAVLEDRVHHQAPGLDRDHLVACAERLIGRLDLSAFAAKRGDPSDEADPVRDYTDARWDTAAAASGEPGLVHSFRITGTGFLYKQVRGLVGAMVAVARGKVSLAAFTAAIHQGRGGPRLGPIAPSEALTLEAVAFDPEPAWQTVGSAR